MQFAFAVLLSPSQIENQAFMKLDILAIGAHPDDVELGCGGTLLTHIAQGLQVGILDLTKGELGTRGNAKIRLQESAVASKILGITIRENLGFRDGFFQNDEKHQLEIIKRIRHWQPTVILANATYDRHPDHGRAAQLTSDAAFLAGLPKIETIFKGKKQAAFRPQNVYHYVQALEGKVDFAVDISDFLEQKMEAVQAYRSQFFNPKANGKDTFISSPQFLEFLRARASHFGIPIGVRYAEGFSSSRCLGIKNLKNLC